MADALCGPSNALSTFQKHSSVDRTLQQDRLVSQRSQEQGFRSAPGPNAGILDAEFEAFQAAPASQLLEGHEEHGFTIGWQGHGFQPPQPQLLGWASDFQNMNLNDFQSSPAPSSQFPQYAPPKPGGSAAWHQEFVQEPALGQSESRTQTPQQPLFRGANSYSMAQYSSTLATPFFPMQQQHAYDQRQSQEPHQEVDDALFEKHFAAAALEAEQAMGQAEAQIHPIGTETSAKVQQGQAFDNAALLGPSIQRDPHQEPIIDASVHDPIGSDRILNDKGKGKETDNPDDGDELARTAGTLLEKVKHDQSQKFKQSNFLNLMRQLRDREVKVEGDKLVEATQPLHPGGDFYPSQQDRSPAQPLAESTATG